MIKKIYLTQLSHCDPGYTDIAINVIKKHVQHIRDAMDLCTRSEKNPEGLKFKWTCEEAWTVQVFLQQASPDERQQFFSFVQKGQIEIGGFFGTLQFELPSYEELIRSCDYSTKLSRQEGFAIQTAIINDVPGLPMSLAEILSGYEIPYLLWGPNTFRSLAGWTELPPLFYLQAKSGVKVLVWHNGQDRRIPPSEAEGFGSEYGFGDQYVISPYRAIKGMADQSNLEFKERGKAREQGRQALNSLLGRMEHDQYPYDAILLQCAADNRGPDKEFISTIESLNKDFSDLSFVIATPSDFFRYIENEYQSHIPAFTGTFIDSWSDGAGSMAKATAQYRKCQQQVSLLEAASATNGNFTQKNIQRIDDIYESLLWYSEHTFGLSGWNWQNKPKEDLIKSWADKSAYITRAQSLLTTLQCPAVSYTPTRNSNKQFVHQHNLVENSYYQIRYSQEGIIESIWDKELHHELIDKTSEYPFNGLIFAEMKGISDTVPAKGSGKYDPVQILPYIAHFRNPRVEIKEDTCELICDIQTTSTPVEITGQTRIVLHSDKKQIDFVNTIKKGENPEKEAIYFSFPFNLSKKKFKIFLEMTYHLLNFPEDLFSGSHSDFVGIQNFAAITNDQMTIVWLTEQAPLIELGNIQTFQWAGSTYKPENPWIFSYIMNNTWPTNFQLWQGGEFTFKYSLTTLANFNPASCYQFKQQVLFPERHVPAMAPEHVIFSDFHLNDDKSLDLRLFEVAGKSGTGTIHWPGAQKAFLTNLHGRIKQDLLVGQDHTIYFPYFPYQLINIHIRYKP
jgi:hypothetical protein